MTEIMPFPENNYETVLLDRPERCAFCFGETGSARREIPKVYTYIENRHASLDGY